MEIRVKSLRARTYFRSSLIGSSGGCPLGYRGFILWMCTSHRFLFLTLARLNRASLVSAVTPLPFSTKYDFYFIPKHFSPEPASHATETKNRYVVSERWWSLSRHLFVSVQKLFCTEPGLAPMYFVRCRRLRKSNANAILRQVDTYRFNYWDRSLKEMTAIGLHLE